MKSHGDVIELLKAMKDHCEQTGHSLDSGNAGTNQFWYTCKDCGTRFEIDVSCVLRISSGKNLKQAVIADQLLTVPGRARLAYNVMRVGNIK